MGTPPFFAEDEYTNRLQNVRQRMSKRDLDACLISSPENIYYLSGLSHQGFFAFHILIVPREGEMLLIARAMEQVTMEEQAIQAHFIGYGDSANPAQVTVDALTDAGLTKGRIGAEKDSLFLPPRITEGVAAGLHEVTLVDTSGLVDGLRRIKSPQELVYTRQAAAVSDAMMQAAIETAQPGANEQDVAAAIYHTMIQTGGDYPGFPPFVRATPTLGQEHVTWNDYVLKEGDILFVELSGCIERYHAPMGRLLYVGDIPQSARDMETVCLEAFDGVVNALKPGAKAHEVYQVWQDRVDRAGLSHYRRHHCGYMVGTGFPPSWIGESVVVGLRHDSNMVIKSGMVFHIMSWLMHTGQGNYFVSDPVIVTDDGGEVLTDTPQHLHVV